MNRQALVLNQDYRPLTICSVQRAFVLVFLQKAEIVTHAVNGALKTVTRSYPAPAVIRLYSYINLPYKGVILNRNNIFKRDGFECQYCGDSSDLTLDHMMPKSRGGKSTWFNLITACKRCNTRKGEFTPEEAGMIIKRRPYKPSYIVFLREFSDSLMDEWVPFLASGA
jgi:5-methylcytosine-specific restriction endonuclease McrA